jgi:alkaline phosphatase isozyme conversion protein
MSKEEIENTIAMINLDTLVGGDKLYIYGGADQEGWIRDQALSIAEIIRLPIGTNPGLNEDYPEGTTGPWSDHAPYEELGIPFAYFEATNWEIGDLDGYDQSEKLGSLFHTSMDNLEFFQTEFPGRVEAHLKAFSTVLYHLLLRITPPVVTVVDNIIMPSQTVLTYTVLSGDALWKIAKKHDTTVNAILELNTIKNPNLIFPGELLIIPAK